MFFRRCSPRRASFCRHFPRQARSGRAGEEHRARRSVLRRPRFETETTSALSSFSLHEHVVDGVGVDEQLVERGGIFEWRLLQQSARTSSAESRARGALLVRATPRARRLRTMIRCSHPRARRRPPGNAARRLRRRPRTPWGLGDSVPRRCASASGAMLFAEARRRGVLHLRAPASACRARPEAVRLGHARRAADDGALTRRSRAEKDSARVVVEV